MKDKLQALEKRITLLCADPSFVHHKWFVEHHLKIVEQLVNELCDLYPEADRDVCLAIVWLHDLGKILTSKRLSHQEEVAVTLKEGRDILRRLDFPAPFIDKVIDDLTVFEQNWERDLSQATIEVRLTSSADGCSHYIGPFMALYWYENPDLSIDDIIQGNLKKAAKDFDRKIVLPEARKMAQERVRMIREQEPKQRNRKYFS